MVDHEPKVHSIENLRIVDGSVMHLKLTRLPITITAVPARWRPFLSSRAFLTESGVCVRWVYMTASLLRCQSIVQVSCNQLFPAFPLPRYLEKWVRRELRFFISY
jgi:hypothetical protein